MRFICEIFSNAFDNVKYYSEAWEFIVLHKSLTLVASGEVVLQG